MDVEEAFKKVLGKKYTDEKVRELINNLSDNKSRTNIDYLEYLNLLEPLNISTNKKLIFKEDTDSVVNNNGKNHVVTNNVNQAGQGTYGTTYRAKTKGLVFKKIVFPGDDDERPFNFNMFCRNTFVESFIQTILSCDESTYSNNICKIVKMYKDSPELRNDNTVLKLTNVKSDIDFEMLKNLIIDCGGTIKFISKLVGKSTTHYIKLTGEAAKQVVNKINGSYTSILFHGGKKSEFKEICGQDATIEVSSDINPLTDIVLYYTKRDKVTFYIQLEPLTGSLQSELKDDYYKKGREVSYHDLYTKYIQPLAKLLQYYNDKYRFYHNDSHGNNVMFKNHELKLIDFGMSCIKYKDKLYSNYEKTKKSCESTDLGIFIVWLLQYANKYLLLDTFNKLEGLINIDDVLSRLSTNREQNKFYLMYTWMEYFKSTDSFYTSILKITPDFILNAGNKHNVKGNWEKCEQLLAACNGNNAGEALRLIDGGADLNCVNTNGMTPLILASESDKLDVVAARLVKKGANLDLIDKKGSSALMTACIFKRAATAMLLINAGADVKLKDNGNNTALEYAKISNLNDVKEAIEKKLEDAGKGGGKTRRAKRRNRTRKA